MGRIPYDKIDKEIMPLVEFLNGLECLVTLGSCIGHKMNPVAEVLFKVTDFEKWERVMLELLHLSQSIDFGNIEIYQWYRLSAKGEYIVDWSLQIVIHPQNTEFKYDSSRLLELKQHIIGRIIALENN